MKKHTTTGLLGGADLSKLARLAKPRVCNSAGVDLGMMAADVAEVMTKERVEGTAGRSLGERVLSGRKAFPAKSIALRCRRRAG